MLEETKYLEDPMQRVMSFRSFQAARWKVLEKNKELRTKAVEFLKEYMKPELEVIKAIFTVYNNQGAILKDIELPCMGCGNGQLVKKKMCRNCFGRGVFVIPDIHRGWGVEIRNALRANGFGEEAWPVWSLDDYYSTLIEVAAFGPGRMEPMTPEQKKEHLKKFYSTDTVNWTTTSYKIKI